MHYKKTGNDLVNHSEFFLKRKQLFEEEKFSDKFRKRQLYIKAELTKQQTITQEDLDLGEKYREIVLEEKAKSEKGKVYFRWEQILKLNIPFDVCFVYGGKNIGKTGAISQYVTNLLKDPNKKVMMMRNTRSELLTGFSIQLDEENGPFRYVKAGSKLMRKPNKLPERGPYTKAKKGRKLQKAKDDELTDEEVFQLDNDPNICGGATCLTGLGMRSFQGAGFPGLTDLFWDECNDVGDLKMEDIQRFLIFILSLEREKSNFRIFLTGNLLRHEKGTASNIFLDAFGIPYDCSLKYFTTEKGIKFLYINPGNAGDLFDGVSSQKHTDLIGMEAASDLNSNNPNAASVKVLNRAIFLTKGQPLFAFVSVHENKYYIVYCAGYNNYPHGYEYIVRVELLTGAYHHLGYFPICDYVTISNQFGNITFQKKKRVANLVKKLYKGQKKDLVGFADDQTRDFFCSQLFDKLLSRYKEDIGDIF